VSIRVEVKINTEPLARLLIFRASTGPGSVHMYRWHVLDGHGEHITHEGQIRHDTDAGALALLESVLGHYHAVVGRNGAR
jgi:hypothetical protein